MAHTLTTRQNDEVIVGHRGAPGYRPEHTSCSYELAYRQGVDWVDVDLVPSRDGYLVARHENEISQTTDVAEHPEFSGRRRTKLVDGAWLDGWFTEDFTLAELKTLRATERIPQLRPNNTVYNGRYEILTIEEVLDLASKLSRELGRTLGTFPEIKHSGYFTSIGLPTEKPLVDVLRRHKLDNAEAPVVVQSFESAALRTLREHVAVRTVRLLTPEDTQADLQDIASYADYIGPEKSMVLPRDSAGHLTTATSLVSDAHYYGLRVTPYTFRDENAFLPLELRSSGDDAARGDAPAEYRVYWAAGVDGLFTDYPDTALAATRT